MLVLVLPYLETRRHAAAARHAARRRASAQLAREEGVGGTPVRIENVHDETTAANAMATGIGPSARVFIWDTFLDGRFTPREIEVVAAHEFGHVAAPAHLEGARLVAAADDARRSGSSRCRRAAAAGWSGPEVVPFALLVLALSAS